MTALFFRGTRANGIQNDDHHIQVDVAHHSEKDFNDWLKDKADYNHALLDDESHEQIAGTSKSKEDKNRERSYAFNVQKRYRHRASN